MPHASRDFQIFAKPGGPRCNLQCDYCYYLEKAALFPDRTGHCMSDGLLETYVAQHIAASPNQVINFSWHGGEPTLLGLDFFHRVVDLQRRHRPRGRRITNGIQTNGTLLTEDWCRFLAAEDFSVGLSLDGPEALHDRHRVAAGRKPTHQKVLQAYQRLRKYGIPVDILCVVHAGNVDSPGPVYRFFKELKVPYIGFLPLVERRAGRQGEVSARTVPAKAFGDFLCAVFDTWIRQDIGGIRIQIFEEAIRTAFGQEQALCLFRRTCGDIPVVEHNGDFFSCDHYVDAAHRVGNIRQKPLLEMLESPVQRMFGEAKAACLPAYCRQCDVREMCNGECPKNRFSQTPEGEDGLNYLCQGYRRFFTHSRPFITELAGLWRQRARGRQRVAVPGARQGGDGAKVGRNEPCPCGSGRKYKKCCLNSRPHRF